MKLTSLFCLAAASCVAAAISGDHDLRLDDTQLRPDHYPQLARQYREKALVADQKRVPELSEKLSNVLSSEKTLGSVENVSYDSLRRQRGVRKRIGKLLLRYSEKPKHRETVAKLAGMKIEDLLKRALSNPAVVRRLEEQLHKSKSVVSLLFSKESRAEMQRAIDRDRQPRVFGVNARNGGKDVQLYKREGEKSLTSIVIEAIKDAENPFAALILALIIFPISVVLDLIGLVIALAVVFGLVLPLTILFAIFVLPILLIFGN